MQVHAVTIVTLLWLTHFLSPCTAQLMAVANFSQQGVVGTITFTQSNATSPTLIQVTLTGLPNTQTYPWHVHQYPFTAALQNPCSPTSVGGHYDPLGAALQDDYSTVCNTENVTECEIGDLSGKLGQLNGSLLPITYTDDTLSLYGRHSIMGRSIVIHYFNGNRFVCANILGTSPNSKPIAYTYVPFRSLNITGNMYIYQYPFNVSTVYVNLLSSNPTQDHNWHVHQVSIATGDENSCSSALGHYNPRNVNIMGNYSILCNEENPLQCEIGDLSNKGGQISFGSNYYGKLQYSDIDLPILPSVDNYSIADRSIVIHARNRGAPRISCANISNILPREAIAVFDGIEETVRGTIKLTQNSPYDPTLIKVNLSGLQMAAGGYHIHVTPIGQGDGISGRARCSPKYTQGHWNPRGVNYNTDPTPITLDHYEVGDISGKFGLLTNLTSITATYTDTTLPLFGVDSSIGRSIVIHFGNGSRWACADIIYTTPINQASALFTLYGHTMELVLTQPANDPYADTTIVIKNISSLPIEASSTIMMFSTSSNIVMSSMTTMNEGMMSSSLMPSLMMSSFSSPSPSPFTSSSMVTSSLTPSPSQISSSLSQMSSFPPEMSSTFISPFPSSPQMSSSLFESFSSLVLLSSLPSMESSISSSSSDVSMMIQPSPSPQSRRRRFTEELEQNEDEEEEVKLGDEEDEEILFINKRETMTGSINWSVQNVPQQQGGGVSCDSLPTVLSNNNDALCMAGHKLGCAGGNLVGKHGPLIVTADGIRKVLTDPYLPLSGPDSIVGKSLFIQGEDGNNTPQLVSITMGTPGDSLSPTTTCQLDNTISTSSSSSTVTMSDISSSMMPSATPTEESTLPFSQTTLIIICVGGAVAILLILMFFLLICVIYCTKRKRKDYDTYFANKDQLKYSKGETSSGAVELGSYTKNPVFSEANYKALYDYAPQQKDDLKLFEGDMVTLIEAPPGGDWWRGKVDDREGWFPKSYVECIDSVAQVKRRKENSLAAAAMTIRAASMAFTTSTATPPTNKKHFLDSADNKKEAESTFIIANSHTETPDSSPMVPRSNTPLLSSSDVTTPSPPPTLGTSPAPSEDIYIAKYDYQPQGDSELELRKGERLIVLERAEGGWWHGMIGDDHGWFPETFVQHENNVPISTPKEIEEKQEEKDSSNDFRPRGMTEFHKETSDEVEATEYRAIFTFSSETEGDLNFNEGGIVLVYWANSNGWWFGSFEGKTGYFPGSYVEAVMTSVAPSLSPPPEEKEEETTIETQEPVGGGGSLSDEISKAFKKRQERSEEREHSPETSLNVSPPPAPPLSLGDEITAALKKRSTSPPTTTTVTTTTVASPNEETKLGFEVEREGEEGNLQNDIMSVLNSFGKNKNDKLTDKSQDEMKNDKNEITSQVSEKPDEKPQTPTSDKRQTYRRKAPPPPKASTKRNTSPAPPKVTQIPLKLETQTSPKVKEEPPTQVPPKLEKATPTTLQTETPLPSSTSKEETNSMTNQPDTEEAQPKTEKDPPKTKEASSKTEEISPETKDVPPKTTEENPPSDTKGHTKQKAPPKVVKQLTTSPSSKTRRVPPPPPSSLATHNKTASKESSPPTTQKEHTNKEVDSKANLPTQKDNTPPTHKEATLPIQVKILPPIQIDNKPEPHLLSPPHIHDSTKKSTGWKPQLRKSKQAAPRRAPPQPPPGGSPVVRQREKQRSTIEKTNKPKVQIVRRPTARSIPPPPSIPLPPPPSARGKSSHIPPAPTSPLPPPPSSPLPPPTSPPPTSPPFTSTSHPPSRPPQPRLSTIEEPSEHSKNKETSNEVPPNRPSRPSAPPKAHDYETPLPAPRQNKAHDYEKPLSFVENKRDDKVVVPAPRSNKPHEYEKPVSVQDKKEDKEVGKPPIVHRQSKIQETHNNETPIQKEENKQSNEGKASEGGKEQSDSKPPVTKPKPPIAKKPSISLTPKNSPKITKAHSPKPIPPVRNSSLPSTPQGSPCPSPSLPHKHSPSPLNMMTTHSPTPPSDTPTSPSPTPPTGKAVPPPRPKPPPARKTSTEQQSDKLEHTKPEHTKPIKVEYPVPKSRRRSREVTNKAQPPSRPQAPPTRRPSQVTENKYYKATKSQKSLEGSDKLSFNEGDTLIATEQPSDREGWIHGMLDDGTTGLFPLTHVQLHQPSS